MGAASKPVLTNGVDILGRRAMESQGDRWQCTSVWMNRSHKSTICGRAWRGTGVVVKSKYRSPTLCECSVSNDLDAPARIRHHVVCVRAQLWCRFLLPWCVQ